LPPVQNFVKTNMQFISMRRPPAFTEVRRSFSTKLSIVLLTEFCDRLFHIDCTTFLKLTGGVWLAHFCSAVCSGICCLLIPLRFSGNVAWLTGVGARCCEKAIWF